jgi:hypothetical protein
MLQTAGTSPAREREGKKNEMCEAPESKKRKKKRPRVAECRREQRETRTRACQRLGREHTNILITRVKEPNNLLSITISDCLIIYAH